MQKSTVLLYLGVSFKLTYPLINTGVVILFIVFIMITETIVITKVIMQTVKMFDYAKIL